LVKPEVIDRVLAGLDLQELTDLTGRLIKINSVWDPEAGTGEAQAAEFVAGWARAEGLQVEVEEVAPGRPNVIVTLAGRPEIGRAHV
jgi:acetylornithine deacetylase/succinyl-diaminopimelate desuccinylase-like protein